MALTAAFRPHAFTLDQALIEEVARARSVAEAALAVDVFRYRSRGEKSWVRNGLGVRA
jgi:UDP-N-acetylmuramate-alanine ligase